MKLQVTNAQAIKSADIAIDGLTIIIGKTNTGKTAILRALDAMRNNRSAKHLVNKDANEISVNLNTGPLDIIWTKKKEGGAYYCVNGKEYRAIGKDVPEEIRQSGLSPVELNNETLDPNYLDQFGPIKVLSVSGGVLASLLKIFSRLDIYEHAREMMGEDLRALLKDIGSSYERVDLLTKVSSFTREFRSPAEDLCRDLESLTTELEAGNGDLDSLENSRKYLIVNYPTVTKCLGLLQDANSGEGQDIPYQALGDLEELSTQVDLLDKLCQIEISEVDITIPSLDLQELPVLLELQGRVVGLAGIGKLPDLDIEMGVGLLDTQTLQECEEMVGIISQTITAENALKKQEALLNEVKKKKEECLAALGYCPMCGKK